MSVSPDEFWQRLSQSNLISEKKLLALQQQISTKDSVANSSTKICRLLIANKLLTKEQAQRLLSESGLSESGPPNPGATTGVPADEVAAFAPAETESLLASRSSGTGSKMNPIVVTAIVLALFGGITTAVWLATRPQSPSPADASSSGDSTTETGSANSATGIESNTSNESPYEIVDTTDALWARENPGEPLDLRFAPAGVQAIMHVRMAELVGHPEGERILRSIGPQPGAILDEWLQKLKLQQTDLETLTVYLLANGTTLPDAVAVAQLKADTSREEVPAYENRDAKGIAGTGNDAIWFPDDEQRTVVHGPLEIVGSLRSDASPALRRELRQLLNESHDTDHVTLLGNPNFLRDEASGLFPGTRRRLLEGLFAFWTDKAQAVAFGMQLTDIATIELRMIARDDLPARRFAALTRQRTDKLAADTTDFLGRAQLDPYWQPLALRLPSMLRFLADQTRVVTEDRQVAASAVLPAAAVHNLLLGAELGFATPARDTDAGNVNELANWSMEDVLSSNTSIRFDQKSLDLAMNDVAQQMRDDLSGLPFEFTIEIVGTELEPEGITRNQQIRDFNASGPLRDLLTQLVMKANPVQNLVSASDPQQKLVWVVAPDSEGKIQITTRSAVSGSDRKLPQAFQSE